MEIKARLVDVSRGLKGGFRLTFQTDEDIRDNVEPLQDIDLRLKAQKWLVKRSLNANAYYYVLLGKIAQSAKLSVTAAHNRTIADYGQASGETVLLKDAIDWMELPWIHLKPTPEVSVVNDLLYREYLVMRGSHTYNTSEMSALIDGTISDAKELGIETLTPEQLESMMKAYEEHYRKR